MAFTDDEFAKQFHAELTLLRKIQLAIQEDRKLVVSFTTQSLKDDSEEP